MIEWRDEAMILAVRPHGETSVIAEVLARDHGRHAGLIRGGASRRLRPVLQPGALVDVTWKARLEDHLGAFTVEPLRSRAGAFDGRLALAGLVAVTTLLVLALPERDAHPALFARSSRLLDLLGQDDLWPLAYLQWELALLEDLGFALDLSACAVTGRTEGLTHVSPRSGRAVCAEAAAPWAARLLPLPPVLRGQGGAETGEILLALRTTGHFIEHRLLQAGGGRAMPEARARLLAEFARSG